MRSQSSFRFFSVLLPLFCLIVSVANAQWATDNPPNLYYNAGHVGIGTSSPSNPLTVISNTEGPAYFHQNTTGNMWISVSNSTGQMNIGVGSATPHPYLWSSTNSLFIGNDGNPTLSVLGMANGAVGINTTTTLGYALAVNGSAIFTKAVVKAYPWSDYVFLPGYHLRPLNDLARYIRQEHHLPGVPSATEVEKDGIDLGRNQAELLKKIEELTLYIIDMEKKNEKERRQVRKIIESQQKEIQQLKSHLSPAR